MTMHNKRTPAHRQLKARAEPNVLDAPTSTPASTPEPSPPPTSANLNNIIIALTYRALL